MDGKVVLGKKRKLEQHSVTAAKRRSHKCLGLSHEGAVRRKRNVYFQGIRAEKKNVPANQRKGGWGGDPSQRIIEG